MRSGRGRRFDVWPRSERGDDAVKALAYAHEPARVIALAHAFAEGCRRHSIDCQIRRVDDFRRPEPVDVVWLYGLGPARRVFDAYAGKARRVVGDVGYWRELMPRLPPKQRFIRIAIDAQQPDLHLRLMRHPRDRFERLPLHILPTTQRGDSILVCGYSVAQAEKNGVPYGHWELATIDRLREVTKRRIVLREKPKNPRIEAPFVDHCTENSCTRAIRKSWAVVCRSGNIGADAVLHGVPVFAESGPGAVYQRGDLDDIDRAAPLSASERVRALSDIAYWQWTAEEFARGELWAHLRAEGVI